MNDYLTQFQQRSIDLLEDFAEIERDRQKNGVSQFQVNNLASRGSNLIHSIAGSKSPYAESMRNALKQKSSLLQFLAVGGVLQALHLDMAHGHLGNIRQEVEAVVVSEILSQAHKLARTKGIHPATAVIVACAGVEEFLRNWCEQKGLIVREKERSIARFAKELRSAGQIELPVERRITSWADYRNDAAHGSNWNKITQELANRVVREIEEFVVEHKHILG